MRVSALVFAAMMMAAPMALAQTETPAPVVTEPAAPETSAPVTEEVPAPEATETTTEAAAPSEEQVCRAGPRSESRLRSRQRVCHTQAEWDALDRARARSGAN